MGATVTSLCSDLKGVGTALASGILAPIFEDVPFMTDEALKAVRLPLRYDLDSYKVFAQKMIQKADQLGKKWTAERVGRALFAVMMLGPRGLDLTGSADDTKNAASMPKQKSRFNRGNPKHKSRSGKGSIEEQIARGE